MGHAAGELHVEDGDDDQGVGEQPDELRVGIGDPGGVEGVEEGEEGWL